MRAKIERIVIRRTPPSRKRLQFAGCDEVEELRLSPSAQALSLGRADDQWSDCLNWFDHGPPRLKTFAVVTLR